MANIIERHYPEPFKTYTWRADYTALNAAYHREYDPDDTCIACNGVGGHSSQELQGDGAWTGWINTFEACPDCICAEKCPGCMQPLSLSFDQSAFSTETRLAPAGFTYEVGFSYQDALTAMPFEGFMCLVCGWQFDPQREVDADNDYYEDEADHDENYSIDQFFDGYPGTGGFYAA